MWGFLNMFAETKTKNKRLILFKKIKLQGLGRERILPPEKRYSLIKGRNKKENFADLNTIIFHQNAAQH